MRERLRHYTGAKCFYQKNQELKHVRQAYIARKCGFAHGSLTNFDEKNFRSVGKPWPHQSGTEINCVSRACASHSQVARNEIKSTC
jgi:hypothetical protein